ncbi:MAG: hypothetical protein Q4G27_08130 [Flavobacteriaceae bacterium]|nr:hypothetical protein [Flavobacteriaceae bacterium]
MKHLYLLIITLLISSCELRDNPILPEEEEISKVDVIRMDESRELPEFSFMSFNEFPQEIDGCSCYFSLTKNAFKNQQFIYAGRLLDTEGFIRKQSDWVKFTQQPIHRKGNELSIHAKNDSLEIHIEGVKDSAAYETIQYKGEIRVAKYGNEVFVGEVYGECGC